MRAIYWLIIYLLNDNEIYEWEDDLKFRYEYGEPEEKEDNEEVLIR